MSALTELRRRNVFKVGAAYAIIAWLLVQVASTFFPALRLPEWTVTLVAGLVILGFPVALILAWAYEMTPEGIQPTADPHPDTNVASSTRQRLNYIILGLVALAVAFLILDRYVLAPRASLRSATSVPTSARADSEVSTVGPDLRANDGAPVRRFRINAVSTGSPDANGLGMHIALSPDGKYLAYAARLQGSVRLFLRPLDQLDAEPISGTEGAAVPFFSPSSEWIGFYSDSADSKLKKVSTRGALPQTLANAGFAAGGSWISDDAIVYATQDDTGGRSLYRIAAARGDPEVLLASTSSEGYISPRVLPGGDATLYTIRPGAGGNGNARNGKIAALSFATGESRILIEGGFAPQYSPTGHVLFIRASTLWAVPFDAERLEIVGEEVPVLRGVQNDGFRGYGAYAISADGLLVYLAGSDTYLEGGRPTTLVWVDRNGLEEPLPFEARPYSGVQVSPDGERVVAQIAEGGNWDIWVLDLRQGTPSRVTFSAAIEYLPVWTPDGERVVFSSFKDGIGLRWVRADGSGGEELLREFSAEPWAGSFTPDGSRLAYSQLGNLYALSVNGERASQPLVQSPSIERNPVISPDGHWIAYESDESGRNEVYVQRFPVDDGKWQISLAGGKNPVWVPQGDELVYRNGEQVMAVSVETGAALSVGNRKELFRARYVDEGVRSYDVSPDGQRFLMMKYADQEDEGATDTQLIVVENWFEELRRLVPRSD